MNLVFDTNVLIAAFISKGACHTLVERCLIVHCCLTSEFILNELTDKLVRKFKYSAEDAVAVESLLRLKMQVVEPILLDKSVCRDSDDDIVLATAITGNAICIVTGDKDLLVLKRVSEIDILPPSEFTAYENQYSSM